MEHLFQDQAAKAFLERCNAIYLTLANRVPKLKRKADAERIMEWVQLTAGFSWLAHPGRYADGRIENAAFEVGERLEDFLPGPGVEVEPIESHPAQRRVLHVATALFDTGGHTRLIRNWIERDEGSQHYLLLTNQEILPLPSQLSQVVEQRHGKLIVVPKSLSMLQRASYLRNVARANFDAIVLHTNPDDVVPIVALASDDVPPVALMNHADHVFWIGSSIADVIIDMRSYGQTLSETRRYAKKSLILPIPLNLKKPSLTREQARHRLNLTDSDVMLLSIGVDFKYIPTKTHNFYQTITKILERNPEARFYQIGIDSSTSAQFLPNGSHERAHFLGRLDDPSVYEVAADLYLEGFPQGSLTAMLETAALGVCTVLMYAPPMPNVDVAETLGGEGRVRSTQSEDEYIEYVSELIENAEERTNAGRECSQFIVSRHSSGSWKEHLEQIYSYLGRVGHKPKPIPKSDFMATASDLGLSVLSNSPYGKTSPILGMANVNFEKLSRDALVSLFYASLRSRETGISYAPMRNWFGMWKHKLR